MTISTLAIAVGLFALRLARRVVASRWDDVHAALQAPRATAGRAA